MADSTREFQESPVEQGKDERVSYTIDTALYGATVAPTGIAVYLYEGDTTDISATNLSGTYSLVGLVISTPLVISLTPGKLYRLEVQFVISGNTVEPYGYILGKY